MKTKQGSPGKDELGKIDFTPKPKNEATSNIGEGDSKVKLGLNDLMTFVFESLAEIEKLQRKAREGRDGS